MSMHFSFLLKNSKLIIMEIFKNCKMVFATKGTWVSFYFTIINSSRVFKENTRLDSVFYVF